MFDVAFDYSATQDEVYRATTKGLIEGLISGYNATVFAYGPTGCGKTYTMLGTDREPGIYVRTLNDLFHAIEETSDDMQYSVSMSYLEIYNEMIRDLLNPSSGFLDLREDSKGEIQVAGITEVSTINAREIMELLVKGNKQRTQEPTAANQTSSRSHAVLQVAVRQQSRCRDVLQEVRFARLFMIDLAGSERASQTQNRGQRLKEGAHINRSLLALGNCINALSEKNGNKYVNYRDSKLTRLLKDSLGGNSRTVMIAHISPASSAFEESRNTLTYADRAKSIRTRCSALRSPLTPRLTPSAEVQAHSSLQGRAEMDQLREQLIDAFRQQMEVRRSLMELENSNMEIQIDTSKHLLTITDWEQERSRRARKWRAERRKESLSKEESEKDSDSPDSPPDIPESQEVAMARENLVALMAEQKKIRKQKVALERRFREQRERARRLEELLPRRVSSEEQREVLGLLCKVHELEIENAEMQSHALLKDNVIRHKNFVVQRFEQHRHLCDEIIQQQRQFINDHRLLVPPHLQELYDLYTRELDSGLGYDTPSAPSGGGAGREPLQDVDSDQESVRMLALDTGRGRAKARRHTLPPILPEPEGDSNRVFKSSSHTRQMKHSVVMTPPPIHINGPGHQELRPQPQESMLSYSHLSGSVSSQLDSSPESSENGADAPLSRRADPQRGEEHRSEGGPRPRPGHLDPCPCPRQPDPRNPKSREPLSEARPAEGGPGTSRHGAGGERASPELRHATSDDNLSSSTGDGPALRLSQSKAAAQRFRPLDSTSDPHLHINGQPPAPLLRPQPRGVPPLTKIRLPQHGHPTGPTAVTSDPSSPGLPLGGTHRRGPHLRPPQPLLYVTTSGTGAQRTRKH
ncbi:hypothetical protein MATL_G00000970 [Megalops atlanticus]|uniref:Kinesin-like protein n=1 Tax=Megalops atlanticus TaxID=7932 RepID=A0A9D3QJW6_MEGAT|nr:hypothetical protein MATL_G00000970 [Megalops atlanticus]